MSQNRSSFTSGRPLRILIWVPISIQGGGVRLIARLADALAGRADVALVTIAAPQASISHLITPTKKLVVADPMPPRWLFGSNFLKILGRVGLSRLVSRITGRITALWLERWLRAREESYDVVYCPWPHTLTVPRTALPIICTFQDTTLLEFPEITDEKWAEAEWDRSVEWISRTTVVVSSSVMRERLNSLFAFNEAKLVRHAAFLGETEVTSSAANALDLPEKYFVYPANLSPHKNHYNLLVAYARFSQRGRIPLLLFGGQTESLARPRFSWGGSWQASRLGGLVTRLDLRAGRDFHALGYLADSQVVSLIRDSAALIMPSLAEGGGSFPVEEALSLGIPVACSDIPVMREHLAERSATICWFDPDDVNSITASLERLVLEYDQLKASAERGQSDRRPTWNEIASDYVQLFREISSISNQYV